MKLFYFAPSHHSRRVMAVIKHLDLLVDLDHRDLAKGEHKTPEILALNPSGWLPILVDGDLALSESNAIMQYLAEKNGPSSLYPADPVKRARVNQWLSWQMCHFGPSATPFVFEHIVKGLFGMGAPDLKRLETTRVDFLKHGGVLNQHLGKNRFVAGDEPTIADFAIASNVMYAQPAHLPMADLPNAQAWYARIDALPAWRASDPSAG